MKRTMNTSLGRSYTTVKRIGSGGMADVFLAREEPAGPLVAIKVLPEERAGRPETVERFRREAVTAGRLRHRHIVTIRDLALEHAPPFFVMEFAPGGSLADRINKNPRGLPEPEIRSIARQILLALDHAHRQRVIHRDIKPENILFDSIGQILVGDFGLARILDNKTLTRQGVVLGTPYYNSPELARGNKVYDGRCDLYSLGVILYEMATGRVPFDGVDAVSVCHRHVFEPPRPPRSLNPSLNPGLEKFILKALEKKAGDRYQSAADMLSDLSALDAGEDLEYDPLPGVIALLNDPQSTVAETPLSAPSRAGTFVGRFLFGAAESPPEPAAGLLVGAVLALVLWAGLSGLSAPGEPERSSRYALCRSGTLAIHDPALLESAAGDIFLEDLDALDDLSRVLLFPMEDRTGDSGLVRKVEDAVAKGLSDCGTTTVSASKISDWQTQQGLSFSALFLEKNLAHVSRTFSATHFLTGVVLRAEEVRGNANLVELELEVALYRFADRKNVTMLHDVIELGRAEDEPRRAISQWLRRRLLGPTGATLDLQP